MTKKCHDSNFPIDHHEFSDGDTCGSYLNRIDQLLLGVPVISEPRQRLDLVNPVVTLQIGHK